MVEIPDVNFFLFGIGPREKFLYRNGKLFRARTGELHMEWDAVAETIDPTAYTVELKTASGETIRIEEDEEGVWLDRNGRQEPLTQGAVKLPTFAGHPYREPLRVTHHEILVNIIGGRPVPNFLVYPKPWYRDAAMMAMVLEKTGNTALIQNWVMGLREPFDRNNAGHREPDNLGQALYMISLVSDRSHRLVDLILDTAEEFHHGDHINGITDGGEHPAYQTKWLKFGLRSLGLSDSYVVPNVEDPYSSLVWWVYKDRGRPTNKRYFESNELYPYLSWAEAHFHGAPPPMRLAGKRYPMTWEAQASQARYEGMRLIDPQFVERKLSVPHTWHAAEMFLYLFDLK
ncbi:MAG: hypothetical protein AB1696_00140 [Planctomycetota bacterium]